MKNFTDALALDLYKKLAVIKKNEKNIMLYAESALNTVMINLDTLKKYIKDNGFNSHEDEIHFFKNIKPVFTSQLIYYNEVYKIEATKPVTSMKSTVKYYNQHKRNIELFFCKHADFYKYYKTGNTLLDSYYFSRRIHDIKQCVDSHLFQSDHEFNTSHDFIVAQILANNQLIAYLESAKRKIEIKTNSVVNFNPKKSNQSINWTGSKVALVELIYALHSSGVLNDGNLNLNYLVNCVEEIFNIKLGQFNRIFIEIKNRKSIEQTIFINSLRENLLRKIKESDN